MYIYEMHQHTAACSACASADPIAMVRALKRSGFAGVVITDHFLGGNTAVRRNQPWEDIVHTYEKTYTLARAEGERLDFDVLFGMEEGVGGGKEVLVYGITPAFLYAHPELRDADLPTLCGLVRNAGGLVFQAHPYRVRDYIQNPWEPLPTDLLDGVEAYNLHNGEVENARAEQFAVKHGLLTVAGSDDHHLEASRFGIVSPHRLRDETALVALLHSGEYQLYLGESQPPAKPEA